MFPICDIQNTNRTPKTRFGKEVRATIATNGERKRHGESYIAETGVQDKRAQMLSAYLQLLGMTIVLNSAK